MLSKFKKPIPEKIIIAPLGNRLNPKEAYIVICFPPDPNPWTYTVSGDVTKTFKSIYLENESGYSLLHLSFNSNSDKTLSGQLELNAEGYEPYSVPIMHIGGAVVYTEIDHLLKSPIVMEFAIALKYMAEQIQKAPPPAQLGLIAAVDFSIIAVDLGLQLARRGYAPSIPEPKIPFDFPKNPPPKPPEPPPWIGAIPALPLTTNYIQYQSIILAKYFNETVAQE